MLIKDLKIVASIGNDYEIDEMDEGFESIGIFKRPNGGTIAIYQDDNIAHGKTCMYTLDDVSSIIKRAEEVQEKCRDRNIQDILEDDFGIPFSEFHWKEWNPENGIDGILKEVMSKKKKTVKIWNENYLVSRISVIFERAAGKITAAVGDIYLSKEGEEKAMHLGRYRRNAGYDSPVVFCDDFDSKVRKGFKLYCHNGTKVLMDLINRQIHRKADLLRQQRNAAKKEAAAPAPKT